MQDSSAYLLSFATTVRAFIIVVLFFVIVFPLIFFLFLLLILFFFHPPTLRVVFAAGVTERSSLWGSLLSIVAWAHK